MKKILIICLFIFCLFRLQAQEYKYCNVTVGRKGNSFTYSMFVDSGQVRTNVLAFGVYKDKEDNVYVFKSDMDCLNFMNTLNWELFLVYTDNIGVNYIMRRKLNK